MNDLERLQQRALAIRLRYNELNKKDGHDAWGAKDYVMGLVGDIGDLTKLVMAKENMRRMDDVDSKLRHELSDCLWSLLVLAAHYQLDLATVFQATMDELDERITQEMR